MTSWPSTDSLERTVENLVKTWEMEASHKLDVTQWKMIDDPNSYEVEVNGCDRVAGSEAGEMGNYKVLMRHCPLYKELSEGKRQLYRIF